ncbi:DUF2384 domain-containing protein [Galbibacter sp. BG1]|uniref:antitoxin Xre/MbcA/ParS toxin-binding domain-containing protein n=1 Tax=Galbibacter sp. BG1 TaxID=1170699 RepID=UPI0015BD15ED|nr:antitoxin Xre/MbcA/ParS toxin-binding domain-containing protein [Galbibacter sp. BG1]QLE01489.1 DUF2384 domain-containing protein [Galbibacter sp. BG1]
MNKELKELYLYGYKVFGDKTKFHLWLESKSSDLNGQTPASFLIKPYGIAILIGVLKKKEKNNQDIF